MESSDSVASASRWVSRFSTDLNCFHPFHRFWVRWMLLLGVLSVTAMPSDAAVDARMFLTKAELTHMLEVANSSMTGRVILNRPGVKVRLFETEAGHRYEAWTIVAAEAKPERHAMIQDDGSLKFKIGT